MQFNILVFRLGWMCPGIIMEILPNEKHIDTGLILLMLLRTLCAKSEVHAIMYCRRSSKIIKCTKFLKEMGLNKYCLTHIDYDHEIIKP